MQVDDYFKDVTEEIRRSWIVVSENIIFDKRSKYTGHITGFFVFIDESVMHFSEFIVIGDSGRNLTRPSYRFHWQNRDESLIKRYDNAPHFPELENFPHHVHYPEMVESFREVGVVEVLDIIGADL